jgi:hypothetical protein
MRSSPLGRDVVAVALFALVACTDHSPTEADLAAKRNMEKSIHALTTQTVASVSVAIVTPVNVGAGAQARADLFDPQGAGIITGLSGYTISWTTSNSSVASISSGPDNDNELVTAKAVGTASICATVNGVRGCSTIQVLPLGPLSAQLTGPTTIPKAGPYRYSATAQSGSTTYTFDWYKCPNDSNLSTQIGSCQKLRSVSGSLNGDFETLNIHHSDGTFTLWVVVTNLQYVVYRYLNIDARQAFEPTLSGPAFLQNVSGETCTWTAHPVGGTPPYSYAWSLDGGNYYPVGSTTAITYSARLYGSSSHTMRLTMTDAAGLTYLLSLYAQNTGTGSPQYPCTL